MKMSQKYKKNNYSLSSFSISPPTYPLPPITARTCVCVWWEGKKKEVVCDSQRSQHGCRRWPTLASQTGSPPPCRRRKQRNVRPHVGPRAIFHCGRRIGTWRKNEESLARGNRHAIRQSLFYCPVLLNNRTNKDHFNY